MTAREADEVLISDDTRTAGRVDITVVHGRYETALNVSAGELVRLRAVIEAHLSTPPADDVREALASRLAEHAERYTRYCQPCGDPECTFMVRKGDGGWNHVDTHGAEPGHPAIGLLTAAAEALAEVRPRGTVTDAETKARIIADLAESYAYVHAVSRTSSQVYKWLRSRAEAARLS